MLSSFDPCLLVDLFSVVSSSQPANRIQKSLKRSDFSILPPIESPPAGSNHSCTTLSLIPQCTVTGIEADYVLQAHLEGPSNISRQTSQVYASTAFTDCRLAAGRYCEAGTITVDLQMRGGRITRTFLFFE